MCITSNQSEEFRARIIDLLDKNGYEFTSKAVRDEYKVEHIISILELSGIFPVVINIFFDIIGISPESIEYFHSILQQNITIEDIEILAHASKFHYL